MDSADMQQAQVRPINLVLSTSPNYSLVQEQILGTIRAHLQPEEFSEGFSKKVHGSLNFALFIRNNADVLMSHGVADKNYLYQKGNDGRRLLNKFRHVLVPGAWQRDRLLAHKYIKLTSEQIHIVGWPRLDHLLEVQAKRVKPPGDGRLNVLWAPSHDGSRRGDDKVSTSSFPELLDYVPQLEREFALTTSLHPRNRENKRPTVELLIEADVVISDFGTLVYEAWALGKPVVFPHWIIGQRIRDYLPESAEAEIFEKRIGLHADSFDEMIEMLQGRPVISDDVRAFLADYLDPRFAGTSGQRVASLLRAFAG